MEVYVIESTKGDNYEGDWTGVVGVYSTLKEAKRQVNRYLSVADKNGDVQFDINDDKTHIDFTPIYADYGYIDIKKYTIDKELDLSKEFDC